MDLTVWQRLDDKLEAIEEMNGWVSPRLGVRFAIASGSLEIFKADREKFLSFVEIDSLRKQERLRADEAVTQLEAQKKRNEAMEEKLREMGIDPDCM